MNMNPSLTREEVRISIALPLRNWDFPAVALMENAGRGAAELLLRQQEGVSDGAVDLCGRREQRGRWICHRPTSDVGGLRGRGEALFSSV